MSNREKYISSLFCDFFQKLSNKYLKPLVLVLSVIIILVILAINANITVVADTPDYFHGESVYELINWLKTEDGFYWHNFIDEVRSLGSIVTVEVKTSEYILTDIQAQSFGYNAFIYTYTNRDNNNDIILVYVRYPVKGYSKYSLEKQIAESKMTYKKSIATISGIETVYYYHDRQEDDLKRYWSPAIEFEISEHRITIMGGYEPDSWEKYGYAVSNQYIEKHDIFLDMFEFHLTPLTDEPFFSLPYIEQESLQTNSDSYIKQENFQIDSGKITDNEKFVIIGVAVIIMLFFGIVVFFRLRVKKS